MKSVFTNPSKTEFKIADDICDFMIANPGWTILGRVVANNNGAIIITGYNRAFKIVDEKTGKLEFFSGAASNPAPAPVKSGMRDPKVSEFFKAAGQYVGQLSSRWLDEGQYEDIKDYKTAALIKMAAEYDIVIDRMIGRPFGFYFTRANVQYVIKAFADGKYTCNRV